MSGPSSELRRRHAEGRARLIAEKPAYPPLAKQVLTAAKAATRFVASGGAIVSQAEYDRRRSICQACPLYDAAANRCTACGCNLALKPWAASESCPEGHW